MKYFEIESLIGDNEFTLCVDYKVTKDRYRIYKDDAYEDTMYEFGFADVITIDTSSGDLTIYVETDSIYDNATGDERYIVTAYDPCERLPFRIGECSSLESAERIIGDAVTWYPYLQFDIKER